LKQISDRADSGTIIDILLVNINASLLMAVELSSAYLCKVQEPDLVLDEKRSFGVKCVHSPLPYFVKLKKEIEQFLSFSNPHPKSVLNKSKTRTALCLSTITEVLLHL